MKVFYSNVVPSLGKGARIAIAVASDQEEAARMIRAILNRENVSGCFVLEELEPSSAVIIEPEF